jgi:hypothetical protein
MTIAIIPNEFDIFLSMRRFLLDNLAMLPDDVIRSQVNRVAEPKSADYVVMTIVRKERLETNLDTYADVAFTASIAVNGSGVPVMDVTSVFYGIIELGSVVFGVGIGSGMYVTQLMSGTGGVGTYRMSGTATLSSRTMAAGTQKMLQPVMCTMQLDVHGPKSADNAHQITTMFRDEYATSAFAAYGKDVAPLYADDPKQVPFINDQKQYEDRWVIEACMQANQAVVNIPQQFFDRVVVGLIEVDSHYPP